MCTRTIRIEFSVLVLPLFEAIRLAEEIATLDVLSGGRIDLGVSRGNTSRYFEAWGLDYGDRSAAFDTVFDKLIGYWTAEKVEVGSRTESVEVGSRTESIEPKCIQCPHPPICVATYGKRVRRGQDSIDWRCSRVANNQRRAFAAASPRFAMPALTWSRCPLGASSWWAKRIKPLCKLRGLPPRD